MQDSKAIDKIDNKIDNKIDKHSNDVSVFMHEIKNPLNNVYLLVQSIEADPSPENIKQSTLLIKQSIKQIQSIERDFNEYRSTGKTTIRPSTVSINALISDLIEEYRPMANKYQVTLVPSYKIGRIYTDATKLRQILGNLISNGIKYNKPNGTVVMTHFSAGNMLKISVKDTGIGMDKKTKKEHVFSLKNFETESVYGFDEDLKKMGWKIEYNLKDIIQDVLKN